MQTEIEMIKQALAKTSTTADLPTQKIAMATAARLLLNNDATEADVTRALALLELAREDKAIVTEAAYQAGAQAMRAAASEVVYGAYEDYAKKPELAWSDMKFLAEQIADMRLPFFFENAGVQ
jgi:hypothetical protein